MPCFLPGLFHVPKPRQTCSQDALRPKPVRCLMPECFDGIGVMTTCVLGEPEKPVVPRWRVRIEANGVAQMSDALDSLSLECLQLPQECPGIGVIGVDPKGRAQFRRAFARASMGCEPSHPSSHAWEMSSIGRNLSSWLNRFAGTSVETIAVP